MVLLAWSAWIGWFGQALAGAPMVLPGADVPAEVSESAMEVVEQAMELIGSGRLGEAADLVAAADLRRPDADLRYLEAWARYESGDLRAAERVVADGLVLDGGHAPLLALSGLILADLGRGEEAQAILDRAAVRAAEQADQTLQWRIDLARGLVWSDRGAPEAARAAWSEARGHAERLGDAGKIALVDQQIRTLEGGGGSEVVGQVSELLSRGDVAGARALAASVAGADRRSRTRAAIAVALVQRAEGRLDRAAAELTTAIGVAREGGLVREELAARLELSRVLHLAGKTDDARRQLDEALVRVEPTSFRVQEVDIRVARGRQALLDDRLETAREELEAAGRAAAGVEDRPMSWRLAELTGTVAAASGESSLAESSLRAAAQGWGGAGWFAEAARVACEGVRVSAAAGRPTGGWEAEATLWFGKASDPLGPVHVQVAVGLGLARAGQDDPALVAFAAAFRLAQAQAGPVAKRMAGVAGADAAAVLKRMQPAERAIQRATELGLESVVAEQAAWLEARAAYEKATVAFKAGRHAEALSGFEQAVKGFDAAGEADQARTARRGLAWAQWNVATGQPPEAALSTFEALIPMAREVGDRDLEVRAIAAAAIAAGRMRRADAPARLRDGADRATRAGMLDLAARCWAELAAQAAPFEERLAAARQAFAMRQDHVGVTAMYRVAVDAYNEGNEDLAGGLAQEIRPYAGDLLGSVDEILGRIRVD